MLIRVAGVHETFQEPIGTSGRCRDERSPLLCGRPPPFKPYRPLQNTRPSRIHTRINPDKKIQFVLQKTRDSFRFASSSIRCAG
jgi:hypothetical protein